MSKSTVIQQAQRLLVAGGFLSGEAKQEKGEWGVITAAAWAAAMTHLFPDTPYNMVKAMSLQPMVIAPEVKKAFQAYSKKPRPQEPKESTVEAPPVDKPTPKAYTRKNTAKTLTKK